jgi:hypothetical protein
MNADERTDAFRIRGLDIDVSLIEAEAIASRGLQAIKHHPVDFLRDVSRLFGV